MSLSPNNKTRALDGKDLEKNIQAKYRSRMEKEILILNSRIKLLESEKIENSNVIGNLKKECSKLRATTFSPEYEIECEKEFEEKPKHSIDAPAENKHKESNANKYDAAVENSIYKLEMYENEINSLKQKNEQLFQTVSQILSDQETLEKNIQAKDLEIESYKNEIKRMKFLNVSLDNRLKASLERETCLTKELERLDKSINSDTYSEIMVDTSLCEMSKDHHEIEISNFPSSIDDNENILSSPLKGKVDDIYLNPSSIFDLSDRMDYDNTENEINELKEQIDELERTVYNQRVEMFLLIENTTKSVHALFDQNQINELSDNNYRQKVIQNNFSSRPNAERLGIQGGKILNRGAFRGR